ncbi:MAG TPA: hypothetical protein PLX41_11950 [Bacteroidales bacterium]|nr:hypothetical protein [Bacteroidales bacterium]
MATEIITRFGLVWTGSFIGVAFIGTGSSTRLRADIANNAVAIDNPPMNFMNADGGSEEVSQSIEFNAPFRITRHIKTVFQSTINDPEPVAGETPVLSAKDARNGSQVRVIAGHFYILDRNYTLWDITYLTAGRSDGRGYANGTPLHTTGGTGTVCDIMLGTTVDIFSFSVSGPPATPSQAVQEPVPRPSSLWVAAPWLNAEHLGIMISNCALQSEDLAIYDLLTVVRDQTPNGRNNRNYQSTEYMDRMWRWLNHIYLPEGNRIWRLFCKWNENKTSENQYAYRAEMLKTGRLNPDVPAYLAFFPMVNDHSGSSVLDLNGRKLVHAYNLFTPRIGPIVDPDNFNRFINGNMTIINR